MTSNFVQSYKSSLALVQTRPRLRAPSSKPLFITISPNASLMHKIKGKNVTYGGMRQADQYEYCIHAFKVMYLRDLKEPEYVGVWEMTKQGNIHLHILLVSRTVKNERELQIFQRDIYNHEITQKNLSKKYKRLDPDRKVMDVMNHIVFMNDSVNDRIKYFDKDYSSHYDIMRDHGMMNFASLCDEPEETSEDVPRPVVSLELESLDSEDDDDDLIPVPLELYIRSSCLNFDSL